MVKLGYKYGSILQCKNQAIWIGEQRLWQIFIRIWSKNLGFGPETKTWDTHIAYNPAAHFVKTYVSVLTKMFIVICQIQLKKYHSGFSKTFVFHHVGLSWFIQTKELIGFDVDETCDNWCRYWTWYNTIICCDWHETVFEYFFVNAHQDRYALMRGLT